MKGQDISGEAVISAGKDQCLRNAYSPVKYNNSLHRQVCVKVC